VGVSRKYQEERAARGRAANKPVKRERSGRGAKGGTSKLLKEGTAASPKTGRAAEQRRASSAAAKKRAAAAAAGRKAQKGKQAAGAKKAAPKEAGEFKFYGHPGVRKKTAPKKTASKKGTEVQAGAVGHRIDVPKKRAATSAAGKKKATPTKRYRRQRRRAPGRVR
tara:strand:- start:3908 stop:4405 length:498 start_codon:yes stop_codon:yes gene_type:complete